MRGWRFRWPLAVGVATVVLLAANAPLVRGRAIQNWDADVSFAPFYIAVADAARAGRLLLWNPWANGGMPDYAESDVGALSPLTVLMGAITGGTEQGFLIYWLFLWWLGTVGVIVLGRHLGAPPWGSCVVAIGYALSGFYTGHASHTSYIHSFAFLPFVVWRLDVALETGRLRPAVEAGTLWGLSALGGYAGLTIVTGCYLALWTVGRVVTAAATASGRGPKPLFALGALATLGSIGTICLAPTYAGFLLESAGFSERGSVLPKFRVLENSLHPAALATFASPYLVTLKALNPRLWEYNDITSCSIYTGAVASVLAFAAVLRRIDAWRLWLLLVAALSLGAALGHTLPIRTLMYDFFLPMRYFRHPALFRNYFLFTVAVLALLGARDLAGAGRDRESNPWAVFTLAAAWLGSSAILAYAVVIGIVGNADADRPTADAHVFAIWLGVMALAVAAWRGPGVIRRAVPLLLVLLAAGDAVTTARLGRHTMYSEWTVPGWAEVDRAHVSSIDLLANDQPRTLRSTMRYAGFETLHNRNVALKIPTLESYRPLVNRFHLKIVKHELLRRGAIGAQRIWFAREAAVVTPTDAAFEEFVRRTETLGAWPLVLHGRRHLLHPPPPGGPDGSARIARLPAAEPVPAELLVYQPETLALRVRCPADGWLLVTDRWSRSWRATVNGHETPVWGGNFIFRAVPVKAGIDDVRFEYHPFGMPWLLFTSWGTIFAVGLSSIRNGLRSWRSANPAAPALRAA